MIFLDASVLLAAEDRDDADHLDARALLVAGALATLDLALYEVTNVATVRWQDAEALGRLHERMWAIAELGLLLRADAALLAASAELGREHGLSVYDAAYVVGARRIGAPLASCDRRDLVDPGFARAPGWWSR